MKNERAKQSSFSLSNFSDLERELTEKQSSAQLLEREVAEGRKRCNELEDELDQVNKEIGEARVKTNKIFEKAKRKISSIIFSQIVTKRAELNGAPNSSRI